TGVWPEAVARGGGVCGGGPAERTTAALKLQVRLERRTGRLEVPLLDGRAAEPAAELPGQLEAGALPMAARGSWRLAACRTRTLPGIFGRSRLQVQRALDTATGQRQALRARLAAQPPATPAMA